MSAQAPLTSAPPEPGTEARAGAHPCSRPACAGRSGFGPADLKPCISCIGARRCSLVERTLLAQRGSLWCSSECERLDASRHFHIECRKERVPSGSSIRSCNNPGCRFSTIRTSGWLRHCGKCHDAGAPHMTRYCSRVCQLEDWPHHRLLCTPRWAAWHAGQRQH